MEGSKTHGRSYKKVVYVSPPHLFYLDEMTMINLGFKPQNKG